MIGVIITADAHQRSLKWHREEIYWNIVRPQLNSKPVNLNTDPGIPKEAIVAMKRQIEEWGVRPTTFMMSPPAYAHICNEINDNLYNNGEIGLYEHAKNAFNIKQNMYFPDVEEWA